MKSERQISDTRYKKKQKRYQQTQIILEIWHQTENAHRIKIARWQWKLMFVSLMYVYKYVRTCVYSLSVIIGMSCEQIITFPNAQIWRRKV